MKRIILPILTVLAGVAAAALLVITGPTVVQRPTEQVAPLVRAITANPTTIQLNTFTHGTVVPRTESDLIPEVSGRVIEKSPVLVSGGFFSEGDLLLKIDTLDYQVSLRQAKAGLARAESDLANARKAHSRQSDLQRRSATSDAQRDDALNRLLIAEATLQEAQAMLARAERDLDRTQIVAPYDGRVRNERVDVGQFVNRGTAVATIYAVDFAEVRLPIHDEELAFLDLPMVYADYGAEALPVTLRARFAGATHEWLGEVVRTEGELDPKTRMVNVVARVPDPYTRIGERPPLSVGLFVDVEIHGATVDDITVLPRTALRPDNQVYVVDVDRRIRFRSVEVLRIAQDKVFISAGLQLGDQVCISALDNAEDGMLVRLMDPDVRVSPIRQPGDLGS